MMRALLAIALALSASVAAIAQPQMTVDANDLVAHVTPLNGVNCGPLKFNGPHEGVDFTDEYRAMGIRWCARTTTTGRATSRRSSPRP